MSEITIKEDVEEMYDETVKTTGTNTYIPASKKNTGKKVKVLVLKVVKED